MKKASAIIIALSFATTLTAQTKVWSEPYVGHVNSKSLKIEKIEFAPKKTSVYASIKETAGSKILISPEAALVANGTRYQIKKRQGSYYVRHTLCQTAASCISR